MIQPRKWSAPLGNEADVQDLPDDDLRYASFSKIFPQITQVPLSAGGVAPQRTDFNTLFKLLGDNIFYIQQGGVFSYSDTADYERGAFVKYNNELYLCIQDNSSFNKHAPTDAEYWLRITTTADSPTGEIKIWTSSTIPDGFLLCNGSAISRTTYANLFDKIGTTYGSGDGSTTFNIPDLRDRYIIGADTNALGTKIAEQLPNITGYITQVYMYYNSATGGALSQAPETAQAPSTVSENGRLREIIFNAHNSNAIYTDNGKVYPASIALNFIIKT